MDPNMSKELVGRAYHEAGHIVAAAEFKIHIRRVAIVTIGDDPSGTRFVPLGSLLELVAAPDDVRKSVEQYSVARLAGPVSEMIHAAHCWESARHTVSWPQWRKRWQRRIKEQDDTDVDYAIAAAFAWSDCHTLEDLERRFSELWRRAEDLLRRPESWKRIVRLATALLDRKVLTGTQALRLIAAPLD